MLDALDQKATRLGATHKSIIKSWLTERLERVKVMKCFFVTPSPLITPLASLLRLKRPRNPALHRKWLTWKNSSNSEGFKVVHIK